MARDASTAKRLNIVLMNNRKRVLFIDSDLESNRIRGYLLDMIVIDRSSLTDERFQEIFDSIKPNLREGGQIVIL